MERKSIITECCADLMIDKSESGESLDSKTDKSLDLDFVTLGKKKKPTGSYMNEHTLCYFGGKKTACNYLNKHMLLPFFF